MNKAGTQERIDSGAEPRPEVCFPGVNLNALIMMSIVSRALRRAGASKGHIKAFREEAMSGNYDNLIDTCRKFTDEVRNETNQSKSESLG